MRLRQMSLTEAPRLTKLIRATGPRPVETIRREDTMKSSLGNILRGTSIPVILMVLIHAALGRTALGDEANLQTAAESSQYKSTSRYADVMDYVRELQRRSPYLRVETLSTSAEGREIPLLVVGKPLPASPYGLKSDSRMVVYLQANIHAGEVEGKEASLMIVRDILLDPKPPYLDKLILIVAPILNADGNEKISPENRRQQPGPENGVGVRHNGQNLDLNRDSIKLESPEILGMVENVLNRWDPLVMVDCHTTDGAYHDETVTWSWPLNPNGDVPLLVYQRQKMLPAVNKIMRDRYNTLGLPYGGFRDYRAPEKGWETFEQLPRYVTNYIGLRNRIAILDENYVHADFKTRVLGNYSFLRSVLDYCDLNRDEIARSVAEADRRTTQRGLSPKETDMFAVEFELKALPDPVTVHGYEMEVVPREGTFPQLKKTDQKKIYTVPYFADFIPKRTVKFPFAYLLPSADLQVVEKLLQHGIAVERLSDRATTEVESFRIKEIKGAERIYQGHRTNTIKGDYTLETREFPAGTIVVRTAQPLGCLAAYLLEPESDDGLAVWNFFDRTLVGQWGRGYQPYPVLKILRPINLVTTSISRQRVRTF